MTKSRKYREMADGRLRRVGRAIGRKLLRDDLSTFAFEVYLSLKGAQETTHEPTVKTTPDAAVLRSRRKIAQTITELKECGLHLHPGSAKNWGHLFALKTILREAKPTELIVDAGGEVYSPIAEWLYLLGYNNIRVINRDFPSYFERGSIEYVCGDFTATDLPASSCKIITALSVIEHGVDHRQALEEFQRVLRPGGTLVLSTDYWPEKITMSETTSYGGETQEWMIFSEEDIANFLKLAEEVGFTFNWDAWCREPPRDPLVQWNEKEYTFWYCELQKPAD